MGKDKAGQSGEEGEGGGQRREGKGGEVRWREEEERGQGETGSEGTETEHPGNQTAWPP